MPALTAAQLKRRLAKKKKGKKQRIPIRSLRPVPFRPVIRKEGFRFQKIPASVLAALLKQPRRVLKKRKKKKKSNPGHK